MVSALLALVGAVVYGSADFFGGLAARRLRSIVVTAISAIGGITALLSMLNSCASNVAGRRSSARRVDG